MLYRDISRILGIFIICFSALLLIPAALAAYYQYMASPQVHPQPHSTRAFILTIGITLFTGLLFFWLGRHSSRQLYRRESLAVVMIIWFLIPAFAGLPFLLSGTLNRPVDAYFEMVSGFTTTGATVMQAKKYNPQTGKEEKIVNSVCAGKTTLYEFYGNIEPVRDPKTGKILYEGIEAVSKALLFWRSFTQWVGGAGIVVLFIAILPALGAGGRLLLNTEMTGPIKDSLTPRIKETAIQLWKIYIGLTLLQIAMLMLTNSKMEWLDAITITFSTLSTGGFSIKNSSIAFYNNAWTEWVIVVFMILGSINFSLYFFALRGKVYKIYEPEFIVFLSILIGLCALAGYYTEGAPRQLLTQSEPSGFFKGEDAIRTGIFQIVSALSSTGFATANYDIWPYALQVLLIIAMYLGGMSGSTAGGIKTIRLLILFLAARHRVESLFTPSRVRSFRVGDRDIDNNVENSVLCFFFICLAISVFGTFFYVATGIDSETALGLVSCNVNNVGLAFREAGPTGSFCFMKNSELLLGCLLMIAGRLEFLALFVILIPAFWSRKK